MGLRLLPSPLLLPGALFLVALAACAGPRSDPAQVVRGPLAVRNQHPFALTLHHPRPRRAAILSPGRTAAALDLAYSSIHEIHGGPGQLVYMDGETARLAARVRQGVGVNTDVELEVAALYATSGFLDSLIEGFHRWTGLPNQGRDDFERDQFEMRLRRNGNLLFDVEEDEVHLADLSLTVSHALRLEDPAGPGVLVRGAVELPTGSVSEGAGNGGVDYALGIVGERTRGRWTYFGAFDWLDADTPDSFAAAGVSVSRILSTSAGIEYRWSDTLSLLGELVMTSPMSRDFTFEEFNREILDVAFGLAWDGPLGARYQAAIEEDAVAATGPDFGVYLGMSWGF